MKSDFPTSLALLKANQGSPVDLQRIQTESLRLALEEVRSVLTEQKILLQHLKQTLERRTSVLSPAKNFSSDRYHKTFNSHLPPLPPAFALTPTGNASQNIQLIDTTSLDDTGIYVSAANSDLPSDSQLRAFVNESPKPPSNAQRERTQVDLVLPPTLAFSERSTCFCYICIYSDGF